MWNDLVLSLVWTLPWKAEPHHCFDLFVVLYHLVFAVVNHPYSYLISYFDILFITWWSSFWLFHPCDLAPSASLWAGQSAYCYAWLLHVLHSCAMFMSNFPPFRAEISSCLSASLGGERQRVWNFRGVCHCRDVARGSDRMISLCISWALLSLSNVVPMVPQSVENSTSVLSSTV